MAGRRRRRVQAAFLFSLLAVGCGVGSSAPPAAEPALQAQPTTGEMLAPGVRHVAEAVGSDGDGVDLIDISLPSASVSIRIAAHDPAVSSGVLAAVPRTPADWVDGGAIAAINGGYFGRDMGPRKELIGLLVDGGRILHVSPPLAGHGAPGLPAGRYVRSAFGLTRSGMPSIAWVATDAGEAKRLYAYSRPVALANKERWHAFQAVGCGPTLIADGHVVVTDRLERLASDDPRPRTFVAYDRSGGGSCHLVLGTSSPMTYPEVAAFLTTYYVRHYGDSVQAAMCLDGGASTQISYRVGKQVFSPRSTGVAVADCIVVVPRAARRF